MAPTGTLTYPIAFRRSVVAAAVLVALAGCRETRRAANVCASVSMTMSAPGEGSMRTDPYAGTDPAIASDLHCLELFPTPAGGDAAGTARIYRPWSPFGVSVTATGHHRHSLALRLTDLPDPAALGPYSSLVAWAAPLTLDSLVNLGAVFEGENSLAEVSLNKYLILITAEPGPDVADRSGPLLLRGRSPSSRMEAHDLTALAPAAELGTTSGEHGHMSSSAASAWSRPPMYPGVPMLAGVMEAVPSVSPWLPVPESVLPEARGPLVLDLPDGGTMDLTAGFVRRSVAGRDLVMMAFNGRIPGPLIRVDEGSTVFVNLTNETTIPTAVHWHGLRLDNRFDGVPGLTQPPVGPGERFRYQLFFPDAGVYWYHPHHREDVTQELGLSGNMLVRSRDPEYYGPADREIALILDDLLLDRAGPVPFGEESSNFALMGRFGNILLVNGEPEYRLSVGRGEIVRFHLTNAANTRTFNLSLRREVNDGRGGREQPLPLKVVASDVSRFERESFAESVVLGPAERYVVEAFFEDDATFRLVNHVQGINHRLGQFHEELTTLGFVTATGAVSEGDLDPTSATATRPDFHVLRENRAVSREIDRYRRHFDRPVDRELVLTLETEGLPKAVEQSMLFERAFANPVEWTGTMPMMNWASSGKEVSWILRDAATGAENEEIAWSFRVGDVVKIRLVNDRWAFHTMQHPLHIHGQRFLVLEQDGAPNENMVWKDTVLLPAGSTTDILLELSNPGKWMVHCHIAEHLESGMSFVMEVSD